MKQFRISSLLWLMLVIALCACWWRDREALRGSFQVQVADQQRIAERETVKAKYERGRAERLRLLLENARVGLEEHRRLGVANAELRERIKQMTAERE